MSDLSHPPPVPRWLRVWAILTACAALPLDALGASVTTMVVGMADRVGFRLPWQLFSRSMEPSVGLHVEHGHRMAGFIVGIACIILAVGLTVQARGTLHRLLGWVALTAVVAQGLLGIFRVDLNAILGSSLALIHGCFAQLVIAVLVSVAVLCSRTWNEPQPVPARPLRGLSIGVSALVYVQVVFGAILRHRIDPVAQRLHVLLAFAVLLAVFWLVNRLAAEEVDRATRRFGYVLAGMVVLQPILGVEAWIGRFGTTELPELVPSSVRLDLVRSGHQVLGTLIFSTTVALAVMLHRRPAFAVSDCRAVSHVSMEATA
jgi:cytochrome c oxidase assembly protein subunit 15